MKIKIEEKGSALILVVMLMSLLLFIPIAMKLTSESFKETKQEFKRGAQADNTAQAGIQAALSWFKQQTGGVVNRNPATYDDSAFAPTDPKDTLEPVHGLVQEWDLEKGSLRARYQVSRQETNPAFAPFSNPLAAHDVTSKRGYALGKKGMAWSIQSVGTIYQDRDLSSSTFNPALDKIVARSRMSSEFRRLDLVFPWPLGAALTTDNANNITLGNNCHLMGLSQPGLVYYSGNPVPIAGKIKGGPPAIVSTGSVAAVDFSVSTLFSIPTERELALLSDTVIDSTTVLRGLQSLDGLVFVDAQKMGGTVTFDALRTLVGSGLMYVNGNLVLQGVPGDPSAYNGIIVVKGNMDLTAPAAISGATMVLGSVTLRWASEGVDLVYDQDMVNRVVNNLLQYRENKASTHVFSGSKQ